MNKHEEFKCLYNKFILGTRWLNKRMEEGTATQKDKDDYDRLVCAPVDSMWAEFTDEEKDCWCKITKVIDLLNGVIVDDVPGEFRVPESIGDGRGGDKGSLVAHVPVKKKAGSSRMQGELGL